MGWQGGLPFHYHIGPTVRCLLGGANTDAIRSQLKTTQADVVTLSLNVAYQRNPGHNVVARIRGTGDPRFCAWAFSIRQRAYSKHNLTKESPTRQ